MRDKYARKEIERRWFVDLGKVGPVKDLPRRRITDRYIIGTQLRLRHIEGGEPPYKLGKKEGVWMVNIDLSEAEYRVLATLEAEVLVKDRYAVEGGSLDIPVDSDMPARWEREFSSDEEASAFIPPALVTYEDLANAP